jgi:hypothetical protein
VKQDLVRGLNDSTEEVATGKRLKNRRKKQKRIEKKVLQQIISTQTTSNQPLRYEAPWAKVEVK